MSETKNEHKESPSCSRILTELQVNKPILIGRSKEPISGFEVCPIEELNDNRRISRYGVGIVLKDNGEISIFRPNLAQKDGTTYLSKNRITVLNKDGTMVEVENEHNLGLGAQDIESFCVGDSYLINAFVLTIEDKNKIRLQTITVNGRDL